MNSFALSISNNSQVCDITGLGDDMRRIRRVVLLGGRCLLTVYANYEIAICETVGSLCFLLDETTNRVTNRNMLDSLHAGPIDMESLLKNSETGCTFHVDIQTGRLIATVDRYGRNCIYYAPNDIYGYIFTNRYAIIASITKDKVIDTEILTQYMALSYIPGPKCIIRNTYKIVPAHTVTLESGTITDKRYWTPVQTYHTAKQKPCRTYEQAKEQIVNLIKMSVQSEYEKGGEIGTFLSGGIDSSLITAIANATVPNINTFCIGFHDQSQNEAHIAQATAKHLHTNHHALYIDENDFCALLENMFTYYDEPYGDSSQVATYYAMKLAKIDVDCVFTGDGGDELFWGYDEYTILKRLYQYRRILACIAPLANSTNLISRFSPKLDAVLRNCRGEYQAQMLSTRFDNMAYSVTGNHDARLHFDEKNIDAQCWHHKKILIDMMSGVPEVMYKVQRAAEANELYTVSPFLDAKMIALAYSLPDGYKFHGGVRKRILRDILYQYVPEEIIDQPKHGFSIPVTAWLQRCLADKIKKWTDRDFVAEQGLFVPEAVERYRDLFLNGVNTFSLPAQQFMYRYLMFQFWFEKYI